VGETTGQTAGMLLGAVIGGAIGGFPGAMIGMAIGGQLGLWIDPPDAPPAPAMGDLGANSFVRSTPVPLAFGQNKLYGGVIWLGYMEADWDNEGSRKNPEWSPTMYVDFAVAHCEGEIGSFLQYFIDDKRVGVMEDEGYTASFVSYPGSATQIVNSTIDAFQAGKPIPAIPFKHTAYTVVGLSVEGKILTALPSISTEAECLFLEAGEEDANPIRVVYNFMINTRWGIGLDTDLFNGDPDTVGSPWKIASDFCDELVQITDWDDSLVDEPRFRYSNVFNSRMKAFDILTDVLLTCRGMIRLKQGKYEPLIENGDETVECYFSDRYKENFVAGGSSIVSRLYADFSAYPDKYWYGDSGKITILGTEYFFYIEDQTSTYIDLFEDLPVSPNASDDFYIIKDNIKEGSFNYKGYSEQELSNIFRVEYIQRLVKDNDDVFRNLYQWHSYDHDTQDVYLEVDIIGHPTNQQKIKTIRLGGIKRKSQAMRMAQFLGDFSLANRYFFEFATGIQGYAHAVGDIIGISHIQTGWDKKEFRIVGMDETENDEIKLECLEYNRYVYDDSIPKVTHVDDNSTPSPYISPDIYERFSVVQDLTDNKIWLRFKRPDDNPLIVGSRVFVSVNGGDYIFKKMVGIYTPSVKLDSLIDDVVTTIPYDNSSLYGSFPSSGSFWIEDELITYTGITGDPTYTFTGCTRGANAVSHVATEYCDLKQTDTPFINFEDSEIGQSWSIKIVAINTHNLVADFSTSPTDTVIIT
jgi:hypothetical protein